MELALPKGMKARMREAIERAGYTSFNAYVADAVREKYARDMGEEMELEQGGSVKEEPPAGGGLLVVLLLY